MARFDRREFLEKAAAVTAASLTAGYTATARGYPVNETIRVGCIGTGGRCQQLMSNLKTLPGAKITAVCDVWDKHLDDAKKLAQDPPLATKEFRQVLDSPQVDAVIIGTPDHWHTPLAVAAVQAGKDVYVEKPLTHDLAEGAVVLAAVKQSDRVVQVGMQQRSMPQYQEGFDIIRRGEIGDVHKVHLTWNRNADRLRRFKLGIDESTVDWKAFLGSAKEQPFDDYRFRNWRWFWDFGGGVLTDLMVHQIDIAHWYLDLDHPAEAATIGDFVQAGGVWETPDTIQTLLRFAERTVQVYFEGTFFNARNAAMCEFMGTKGTLYVDRGRLELHPERESGLEYRENILGKGPRGADFYVSPPGERLHLANWLECIRSRAVPNAPVEAGVRAVLGAHLGNRAYREGTLARWQG